LSGAGTPIAVADVRRLSKAARRTSAVRAALLAGVFSLFVLAFLESRGTGSELGALLPKGTTPIVALDTSASISGPTNRRVLRTLQTLASGGGTAGLVVFSDTAYELQPPGTPARELRPLMRFFRPVGFASGTPEFSVSPWSADFKAGTRISAGLDQARLSLERAGARHGSVILVSDLDDPEAASVLAVSVGALRRDHIALRIVPLFPFPKDLALWRGLVGGGAIAASPTLPRTAAEAAKQEAHPFRSRLPVTLLVLSGLLVLVLAVHERVCGRLVIAGSGGR